MSSIQTQGRYAGGTARGDWDHRRLISILLPMVGKAKETANRTVCSSNIRQLIVYTLMYVNDNRGLLPRQGGGNTCSASFPRGVIGNWEADTTTGPGSTDGSSDMLNMLTTYMKLNLKQQRNYPSETLKPSTGWYWTVDSTSYSQGWCYGPLGTTKGHDLSVAQ